ncbi:MAG TPA: M20/M25/M40 family metallo-hydrolase [Candidatus Methylomirabilis sp.]|nr:M20/M25/M40 family metallo-hydrolase [Candidatus Methylomirabilis sp.]
MKRVYYKTFAEQPGRPNQMEDAFVNVNRRPRIFMPAPGVRNATAKLSVTLMLVAFALPLAAQIPGTPTPQPIPTTQSPLGNTTALAKEAEGWLAGLVRINTTNPPGNEELAAKYIAGVLTKEGLNPDLLELGPGRSAVVARLRSAAMPNPSRALLLVAHMDVVGVDKSKWTVDPFGAVIKDGYLYGRGSIDDKGMLAANLAAFVALKRSNARVDRDVIFLATADEEQGGDASIRMLIAKYWDKFAAGFALNEGGRTVLKNGKVQYVAVQASEKVSVDVAVIARGPSGHGSMPTKDNAVVHLAAAVAKIGAYSAPVHFTTVVRRYFEQLASLEDDEIAKWIRSLDTSDRGEHAQRVISEANPLWNSMLRDTIAPTMLSAGVRANVIPSEARAVLNIRLLPGDTIDVLLGELTKLVNDPQVRFEILPDAGLAAPPSSLESDFYAVISKAAAQEFPGTPALPFMSTGATDSAQLRLHDVQAYGVSPFPMTDEDARRVHGDDERIPLASFDKGVDFLARIVSEFAAAR